MTILSRVILKGKLYSYLPKSCSKRKQSEEASTVRKHDFSEIFPPKFFQRRHKTPESLYLANPKGANMIANALKPHISGHETLLEFNPGIGLMSEKFVAWKSFKRIIFCEPNENAAPLLQRICDKSEQDFLFKCDDFVNMWKMVFQDKIDNGSRLATLLESVPRKSYSDDVNMAVFGCTGSNIFFKHLINSIVFQTSLYSFGRCELFVVMPPPIFIHLTCSNEVGYLVYRSTTVLFQILFEHQFIAKVPRKYFLPEQTEFKLNKSSKLAKINSIDPEYLYLVKVVPRRNLFDICPVEDIQALWYFVKQNNVSRRNRVIPNLEKFVPGCGPRLILNSESAKDPKPIYPNNPKRPLPKYSTQCVEMSNNCFLPHLDIYTSFGDLTPSQMLTLFCQFRKWPEYKDSSFLASLENSLLKLESTADESDDALEVVEDDDSTIQ